MYFLNLNNCTPSARPPFENDKKNKNKQTMVASGTNKF